MPFCPIGHMMILQGGEGKFKNDSGCIKYVLFYGFVLPILFSNVASSHQVFFFFFKTFAEHSLYLLDSWFLSFDQSEKLWYKFCLLCLFFL